MKRVPTPILIATATALLGTANGASAQPLRPGISAYMTLTSDYRSRGMSQSHGEPSMQLGVDYQSANGFFTGAWAADVDYANDGLRNAKREIEVDYYAGYNWRNRDWSLAVTIGRYTYPGSVFDYDYDDVSGSVSYRERIFFTASYTDDLYSRGLSALNQELSVVLPLAWDMELGASLGQFSWEADNRYTHWNVGITKVVSRLGIDLRYYDTGYDTYGPLGSPADDRWVLSASYGINAR